MGAPLSPQPLRRHWAGTVLALGLALLTAAPLAAQTLPMRSGEHASFTRLTLPLPPAEAWRLGRTADGYGLRLPPGAGQIDTAEVFARIPRDRLAALRPMRDGLDLVIGCDCHAIAFREGPLLVIDIRDGAPPAGARFEARLDGPRPAPRRVRPAFDWTRQLAPLPDPGAAPAPQAAAVPAAGADSPLARDLLARQLARASAQGLIGGQLAATEALRHRAPTPSDPVDPLRNLLIDAETAVDRARRSSLRPGRAPDGSPCPAYSRVALADWGDGRPLAEQIAEARAPLVGEFDMPDAAAVTALARLYLHAGFGAEALALLAALPAEVEDAWLLRDLARLVDEAAPLPDSPLAEMTGCDGAVALWALLAAPDPEPDRLLARTAIKRAFFALPLHLRRHLGPPLVQRFLDMGDTDTALSLRESLGRAPPGPAVATELAIIDGGLALARGRPDAAQAAARPAAEGNAPSAAEALALTVEALMADGRLPDADMTASVVTLAREHRGTPLGARLTRLEALSLAGIGRFDAAFAVRDRLQAQGDANAAEGLARELLAAIAQHADEMALLPRVLAETGWRGGALAPDARLLLAERLLAAGLAEAVVEALPEDDALNDAEAVLAARAALALGDGRRALRVIAGRPQAEAAALRGAALAQLGDHRAAMTAYLRAEDADAVVRQAFLAGAWRPLTEGDTALAELARKRSTGAPADPPPAAGDPQGTLAQARALLEASTGTRNLTERLLVELPAPAGE